MKFEVWIAYVLTEIIIDLTPGPAVMLVSSLGMKYGTKPSFFGALGISCGNLLYFILSALGLGTLILAAGDLFKYIQWAGAIYLIWTGLSMIYQSFLNKITIIQSINHGSLDVKKTFLQGFITQSTNPKAVLFFIALLPQFLNTSTNVGFQFFILGTTTIVLETSVLAFYGWLAHKGSEKIAGNVLFKIWQDRLAGAILVGIGIHLFFMK